MAVLSQEDLDSWQQHGYVIARRVIDRDQAQRTARAVWDFAGMNPEDPQTWYPQERRSIMVEMYHHQTQWDNRTAPRVHEAFSQVIGTPKLWVSHDRVSINPPERDPEAPDHGLHWDISPEQRPAGGGVQGVLYLSDTPADQGAFICVPGFHRRIDTWLEALPEGADPRHQDLLALGAQRIGAEAGDLIIWHSALPHTASTNRGSGVRVAQYITMNRAGDEINESRVNFWKQRLSGLERYAEEREHHESRTAKLTPLGRKLAGIELWD